MLRYRRQVTLRPCELYGFEKRVIGSQVNSDYSFSEAEFKLTISFVLTVTSKLWQGSLQKERRNNVKVKNVLF